VTAQILDRVVTAYRIGDPQGTYPIFDAAGSQLYPGRWNTPDTPVIYASAHYSTAMLEKLVHAGIGKLPPNQHFIEITIPNGTSYEMVSKDTLPGWDDADEVVSKAFGSTWVKQNRSAVLFVPSVVARMEHNILFNPAHEDFARITHSLHQPVYWDARLFDKD
jgi:RES domain-containing protein